MQKWIVEQFAQFNDYYRKSATLLSKDLIAQLAIEQTIQEFDQTSQEKSNMPTQYFGNEEDAKEWLFAPN